MHENPKSATAPKEVLEEFQQIFEDMETAHYSYDADLFCSYYHEGFSEWKRFDDVLAVGVDVEGIRYAIEREKLTGQKPVARIENLQVFLYGDDKSTAVATFYFVGTMVVPEKYRESGVWRVTSVWARNSDKWKICHLHTSPLNLAPYLSGEVKPCVEAKTILSALAI